MRSFSLCKCDVGKEEGTALLDDDERYLGEKDIERRQDVRSRCRRNENFGKLTRERERGLEAEVESRDEMRGGERGI